MAVVNGVASVLEHSLAARQEVARNVALGLVFVVTIAHMRGVRFYTLRVLAGRSSNVTTPMSGSLRSAPALLGTPSLEITRPDILPRCSETLCWR